MNRQTLLSALLSLCVAATAAAQTGGYSPFPAQNAPQSAATAFDEQLNGSAMRYMPIESYAEGQRALPVLGLKTNLLYGAGTLTPNLAVEVGLGRRTSIEFLGGYNPWNLEASVDNDRKLVHMLLRPEFRYWLCERFNGHFFGADAIFARYNVTGHRIKGLMEKPDVYNGITYGAGATYGYHLMLGKRWGAEFAVGAGVLWFDYDRIDCENCTTSQGKKVYFGPTNAAINLIFLIK
jgi:hypothetical protein